MPLDPPVTSTARPASGGAIMNADDTVAAMHLLVSVASATDAVAALAGGADIVDAKDPRAGALGAVSLDALAAIEGAVAGRRPVSAAIGDASEAAAIEEMARAFAAAGAAFVKVGFAGIASAARVEALAAAARHGVVTAVRSSPVVLVAYADDGASVGRAVVVAVGARVGAQGGLLDTANKRGPGLPALIAARALTAWAAHAPACDLFGALAGRLTADDIGF